MTPDRSDNDGSSDLVKRINQLLDRLRATAVVSVRVDDYLAIQTLIASRPHLCTATGREELRHAISAILASDRQSWQTIWDLTATLETPGNGAGALSIDRNDVAEGELPTSANRLRRQSLLVRLGIAATVMALALGIWAWRNDIFPQRKVAPPASDGVFVTTVREAATQTELSSEPINTRKDFTVALLPRPLALGFADYAMILGAGLAMLIGGALTIAPGRLSAKRRREAEALRERGMAVRTAQSRAAEANAVARSLMPTIAAQMPISDDALADSATILARIYGRVETSQLDIGRTITATVTDGVFRPIRADRNYARHLIVLVDTEKGQHPWQDDIDRLLSGWRRLGVDLVRYDFAFDPGFVRSADGRELSFDALARKAGGESLLIVSRRMTTRSLQGGPAAWLDELPAWPTRALLDPAPVAPDQRPVAWRAEMAMLRQSGLARFSLTDGDVRALSLTLAGGVPARSPAAIMPERPPVGGVQALRRWALFAALSPGARWRQLQHARARLPEIEPWFPYNHHLQRLIDWAARFNRDNVGERPDGSGLALDDDLAERIVMEERMREADLAPEQRFEGRCRRLLLEHLRSDVGSDPLMLDFRLLKEMEHLLAIAPHQALPIAAKLSGGAWHDEALATVNIALARDRAVPDMRKGLRDALRLVVDERGELIRLSDLFKLPRPKTALLSFALLSAFVASAVLGSRFVGEPSRTFHAYLPADVRIVSTERSTPEGAGEAVVDTTATTETTVAGPSKGNVASDILPRINRELANRYAIAGLQPYFCEAGQVCDLGSDTEGGIRSVLMRYFDLDKDGAIARPEELDNISCDTFTEITRLLASYASGSSAPRDFGTIAQGRLGFSENLRTAVAARSRRCG